MGDFEELVALAVAALEPEGAYGASIQRMLQESCGRGATLGAIYITLQRLEAKGLLRSREGGASAVRGGRRKRLFVLSASGRRALASAESARQRLRSFAVKPA